MIRPGKARASIWLRTTIIGALLFHTLSLPLAYAQGLKSTCVDGAQSSGAIYRICMPEDWNGDLVLFAHGYIAFNEPLTIPEDQLVLPDGTSLPEIVNGLGYAFATTSYRANGIVVLEAVGDILDLVQIFAAAHAEPAHIYLVGASEGGIVTALAVERHPDIFDGGLAACGPIGDFRRQINYWGDFRTLFDYFFPGVVPGSPIRIPSELIEHWEGVYQGRILEAIQQNKSATRQLLDVAYAPTDWGTADSVEETVLGLMWYNAFATNDGVEKLGGQPFDNRHRIYLGSSNDWRLNWRIPRFRADAIAVGEIEAHYQTTGKLNSPLVTLHTTGDPIIPYWHKPLYRLKTLASGSTLKHVNIPVFRYGHCNFEVVEVLVAFGILVLNVTAELPAGIENVLPDVYSQKEFFQLLETYDDG